MKSATTLDPQLAPQFAYSKVGLTLLQWLVALGIFGATTSLIARQLL